LADKTVTVRPSGGTYTTLQAAFDGEVIANPDLTAGGMNGILTISIEGDWSGGADTTAVSHGTFTTDSTHYIIIKTDAANRAGTAFSASKYRLEAASIGAGGTLNLKTSYTRCIGLQVRDTTGANYSSIRAREGSHIIIDSCLAYNSGWYGMDTGAGAEGTVFVNCISRGSVRQGLVTESAAHTTDRKSVV
jgi:hypothetical protein